MTVIFLCMTGPEKAIRKINRKGQGGEEYSLVEVSHW